VQRATDEAAKGGPTPPNPNTADRVVCGLRISVGRIQFGGRPLSVLTNGLTAITQRRVVDRTGLTGDWEFDITFNPPSIPPGWTCLRQTQTPRRYSRCFRNSSVSGWKAHGCRCR
jgi:uncharacterized protein (TIGR03435 family)